MFGVTLRAAGTAALMPVAAALLGRVLDELISIMNAPNSMLVQTFTAVSDNALLIGLLAALVMLLAKAVTESEVRA